MATEVLLMADVADLGSEGQVVTVADGYARNYLLPRKLGAPVTVGARARLERMRKDRESARKADLDGAREKANSLATASVTIAAKTGEGERLYGSVTTADISDALKAQGIGLDRQCLVLDAPIKELGVYDVKVKLHPEVETTVKVWVVQE